MLCLCVIVLQSAMHWLYSERNGFSPGSRNTNDVGYSVVPLVGDAKQPAEGSFLKVYIGLIKGSKSTAFKCLLPGDTI